MVQRKRTLSEQEDWIKEEETDWRGERGARYYLWRRLQSGKFKLFFIITMLSISGFNANLETERTETGVARSLTCEITSEEVIISIAEESLRKTRLNLAFTSWSHQRETFLRRVKCWLFVYASPLRHLFRVDRLRFRDRDTIWARFGCSWVPTRKGPKICKTVRQFRIRGRIFGLESSCAWIEASCEICGGIRSVSFDLGITCSYLLNSLSGALRIDSLGPWGCWALFAVYSLFLLGHFQHPPLPHIRPFTTNRVSIPLWFLRRKFYLVLLQLYPYPYKQILLTNTLI